MASFIEPVQLQPASTNKYYPGNEGYTDNSQLTFSDEHFPYQIYRTQKSSGENNCGHIHIDWTLVSNLKQLLTMYSLHVNKTLADGQPIVSGGLQQFLNRNVKNAENLPCDQPRLGHGSATTTFHDIPVSAQLEIFSYLDAQDLCRVSAVCKYWADLSSDNILWQHRLERDVKTWHVIGHSTNPLMYKECQSDWSNKEIYLKCSPEVNFLMKQDNMGFHNLSSALRSLLPKKTPKIAMFGPGLESGTRRIVRKMLEDKAGMFKTIGMFPGQFEGVGSGFTMKMGTGATFNLITLYTATKEERENRSQEERLRGNRLLADHQAANDGEVGEADEVYEVRQSVKGLCQTLDGFIFVVNAEKENHSVSGGRAELFAMVNEMWTDSSAPVMVMSCVSQPHSPRIPCVDIVSQLSLQKFNRPWQVHDCVVDSMSGVTSAVEWLVERSHRK